MPRARIYPYPVTRFKNETEERLYNLFAEQLDSDYTVLYGRSWSSRSGKGNPDIECDFVVAKPGQGILVIEAKGGIWERRNGTWKVYGEVVEPEDDPFEQAIANKHELIHLLKSSSQWNSTYFPIDHAVALPDCGPHIQSADLGLVRVLTHPELNYCAEWMDAAMADCVRRNGGTTCTSAMVTHLVHSLMKDYTVRLRDILNSNEEQLAILTEQQLTLDRNLARRRRVTVQGCAGSGKTLMAIKQTKRLSREPNLRKILFTCFNRELGQWLQEQTQDIRAKCDTTTFMTLCEDLATKAGLLSGRESRDSKDKTYFDNLPYLLMGALEKIGPMYDAIVVDEGQIFKDDWWDALQMLLRDPKEGYLYIFYDELQRIYMETYNSVPGDDEPIELTVNLRNTARIHRQVTKFLPKTRLPDCNNIPGEPVEIGFYDDDAEMQVLLRRCLHRLIREGAVSSKDIIILTSKSPDNSSLSRIDAIGPYRLSRTESNIPESVRYTSIQAFRGMERKVVILTELEGESKHLESLLYLGGSRAKTKLVMLVPNSVDRAFRNQLAEGCVPLGNGKSPF